MGSPDKRKKFGFKELMAVLNEEAERLSKELGGTVKLMARGLDLRPRLSTEKKNRTKSGNRKLRPSETKS